MKRLLLLLLSILIASSAFAESEFIQYRRRAVNTRFCGTLMDVTTGRQIQVAATGVACVFTTYDDSSNEPTFGNFSTAETVIGTGGAFCQVITDTEIDLDGYLRVYCESSGIVNSAAYQLTLTTIKTDLADNAITTAVINSGAITSTAFAVGAINNAAIDTDAIDDTKLNSDTIGAEEIGDAAIHVNAIEASAITSAAFATGAIDANAVDPAVVVSTTLAPGGITAASFATGAIDANAVDPAVVVSTTLAPGGITAASFATGAIDANAVDASALTAITANTLATNLPELATVPNAGAQTIETILRANYQRVYHKVTDDNVTGDRILYETDGTTELCRQPLTKVGNVFTTGVCVP